MTTEKNELITLKEACRRTTYSRASINNFISKDQFPQPVRLGEGRRIAFVASEIDQWIADRIAQREQLTS